MENNELAISALPGEKRKSFREFGFSVQMPVLTQSSDFMHIKFTLKRIAENNSAMIVDKCIISTPSGERYYIEPEDVFYAGNIFQKHIELNIDFNSYVPKLDNLQLTIILCDQSNKKYEICYSRDSKKKVTLNYILWNPMDETDQQRFISVMTSFLSSEKKRESTEETNNQNRNIEELDDTLPEIYTQSQGESFTTPTLEEYKRAIYGEMKFLQNNGGRKYRVTNGTFISRVGIMYSYHFELEAELYISDDAPIKLMTGGMEAEGTVLDCEGFQIIVFVDRNLGTKVNSGYISVEPWKLLEALYKKLDLLSSSDEIALKFMEEGPELSRDDAYTTIKRGQELAKQHARKEEITVIWGPPGTGKTYTMSELAIDFINEGKTVLVVSHSNISVDGVVNQVASMLSNRGMEEYLKSGKILRYGYVREEKLSKNPYAVAFNYALGKNESLKLDMERLLSERDKMKGTGLVVNPRRVQIEKELKAIRTQIREEEKIYAGRAQFLATTISKVNIDSIFDGKKYDVVMFDEVSMAYVPQLISAAAYAKEHFIAVGDFRQLAPIAQSGNKTLEKDVFSYLNISSERTKIYNHPWLVMLNEQRRMHPKIAAFPNKYIYISLLKNHKSVKEGRNLVVNREPFAGNAMNMVDLFGTYCAASKNSDNSRFNIVSAVVSFATALKAEREGEDSIGIITPYAAQSRIIRAMIQDYRKNKKVDISCSTVHQFQGSERNLIVFDGVESYPSSKPGWLMSKNDNGSVTRLINVAVTRARGKFVVIANSRFWLRKLEESKNIFYKLIKYLEENENVISQKDEKLQEYLETLHYGNNIKYFSDFEDCSELLEKDISKAKNRVILSIPDGHLVLDSAQNLLACLKGVFSRRVRLLIKSNDYTSLPDSWKNLCWGSEDAIFPMMLIDDDVIWYGVPDAHLSFKDGDWSYPSSCKTIFRITGEHTVELIKSLTDIEYRVLNKQRKPLLEKNSKDEDGKGSAGLSKFVEEYAKCTKCSNRMNLVRNRAGKVFLKCPACNEVAYLTTDFTNWYISKENVVCPECRRYIKAGLGKYGIYVKCDNGHFMKPDEI